MDDAELRRRAALSSFPDRYAEPGVIADDELIAEAAATRLYGRRG